MIKEEEKKEKTTYYAVRYGRKTGVYTTWSECEQQVKGFSGAIYKSFTSETDAESFAKGDKQSSANKKLSSVEGKEFGKEYTYRAEPVYMLFESDDKSYCVASYDMIIDGKKQSVKVSGYMLPFIKGMQYDITGTWKKHPKYGLQFTMTSYKDVIEQTEEGIIKYLSSGLIAGIGRATAEKIVKKYGLRTLDVMDNDIEQLISVKGVSRKKLDKIKTSYLQNRQAREVVLKLGRHGISSKLAMKAYAKFKEHTAEIIRIKPYMLCMVNGISFPVADALCEHNTEEYELDYDRFKICAKFVLYSNELGLYKLSGGNQSSGSIGMPKDDFGAVMYRYLRKEYATPEWILQSTIKMIQDGELTYKTVENDKLIFSSGMDRIELATAEHIKRIADKKIKYVKNIDSLIKEAQMHLNITMSAQQEEAVRTSSENGISVIIGPPGTGKTTTIKTISYVYKKAYPEMKIVYMAPSGKAASRIKETTGETAYTVHSRLEIGTDMIFDVLPEEDPKIENSLVIVDEMSMLDARTSYQLFSAIGDDCKVIICGDDEQLQSVGAGAVLRDMIDSEVIPVTKLTEVYRQGKDCNIYINSFRIRNGETDLTYGNDFQFREIDDTFQMQEEMINTYCEKVAMYGIENVMLISPFKKHDAGVEILNKVIQEKLNPLNNREQIEGNGKVFRINDLVMQLKNDGETGIVNGDIGVVTSIYIEDKEQVLQVTYANNITKAYSKENLDELDLAYAFTVHKSQGSEAKCVITCIHEMHSVMLKRNIFYTAITRAKNEVVVFGQKEAMKKAIQTEDKTKRYTMLKPLLRLAFGEITKVR